MYTINYPASDYVPIAAAGSCFMENVAMALGFTNDEASHLANMSPKGASNDKGIKKYVKMVKENPRMVRATLDKAVMAKYGVNPWADVSFINTEGTFTLDERRLIENVEKHIERCGIAHTYSYVLFRSNGTIFAYGSELVAKYELHQILKGNQ